MQIGVPREIIAGERRVAVVPEVVPLLLKAGHVLSVERGAGIRDGFTDDAYREAGAQLADGASSLYGAADLILKVQRPALNATLGRDETDLLREGAALIGLLQPSGDASLFAKLAARNVTAFSMELVPRTSRAQMMDALSSQLSLIHI